MVTENLKIGQIIKRFRVINDIRQEDMAEKLGVSRATLINYEKGHTVINVDFLKKLERNYPNFKINDEYDNKPQILENNFINFKVLLDVILTGKKKYCYCYARFNDIWGFNILYIR